MPLPQKKLIPGILLFFVLAALAAPPLWWTAEDIRVIETSAPENNHGPANIGQAKHMAKSALDALRPVLPSVAEQIAADLSTIVDLTIPNPKPADWSEKQKAPLLIGQLKAIADPFYTRLHASAPTWLEAERIVNQTNSLNSIFPWTAETTDDQNKAIANIGQLKAVFALRFSESDSDTDGLPDLFELANGLNHNDNSDASSNNDGDTLNNVEEYLAGTNPFRTDTNGDGLPDQFEVSLLGHWNLNEELGGNTLRDSSRNNLDGQIIGGSRIQDGVSGSAVSLTDTQQMMFDPAPGQLNVGANGSDFSVSFWMRLHASNTPSWHIILQKGATSNNRTFHLSLRPDGKKLHARLSSNASVNEGIDSSVHDLVPLEWTHISYVHGGGQLKLYINGLLDINPAMNQAAY